MIVRHLSAQPEGATDVLVVEDVFGEVSAGVRAVEQPPQLVAVIFAESTQQVVMLEVARSPLQSTVEQAHAAERSRVQRTEPQQGNGVLSQRAIQEQVVPSNEMSNEVAHAPSGAERLVLPLLGGEVAEQHPNVSSLIAHHPATSD